MGTTETRFGGFAEAPRSPTSKGDTDLPLTILGKPSPIERLDGDALHGSVLDPSALDPGVLGHCVLRGSDDDPRQRSQAALEQLARADRVAVPERQELEELLARVRNRVAQVLSRCAAVDVFVAAQLDFSATTDDVESVYADLQLFCRRVARLERERPDESALAQSHVELLHFVVRRLIDAEHLLAHQVDQWLLHLLSRQAADSALRLFLTQVTAWHAYVERGLESCKQAIERRLDSTIEAPGALPVELSDATPRELAVRADELIRAHELEVLSAFSNLARLGPERLAAFVREDRLYGRRQAFAESVWSVADLVLGEVASGAAASGEAASGERANGSAARGHPLVAALCESEHVGRHFRGLVALLEDDDPPVTAEGLVDHFGARGIELSQAELETTWRALVVAHPEPELRLRAAAEAPLDSLWLVLAYPRTSISSLWAIAEQVASRGDDDLRKVLYDCIKSRLFDAIAEAPDRERMEQISRLVLLFFRFAFFIQTRYFEQLETLLHLFRSQARRFGLPVDSLDRQFHRLEVARLRADSPDPLGTTEPSPAAIAELPLPVQRHLAREGAYLLLFACHPNNLIAREVVHYLHRENLGRFLALPELNRQMLEEALRRIDLAGRSELVLRVLTHPKCPMVFASRHLPALAVGDLHRVVQNRSTHSEVKRKAMLLMIRKKAH